MGELDRASLIRNQNEIRTRLDGVSEAIGGHAKQLTNQEKRLTENEKWTGNLNYQISDQRAAIEVLVQQVAELRRPWYQRLFSFRARPTEA